MKHSVVLAMLLILVLSSCSLPGQAVPTATAPSLPPAATKGGVPLNTLPPLPTFTKPATTQPQLVTATSGTSQATQPAKTQTAIPATKASGSQSATQVPPTETKKATALPATATQAPANSKDVKMFFIALNDNGASGKKIGCGDSLVGVSIAVPDANAPLRGALDKLLAVKSQNYGQSGLYNALFRSDLAVKSVTITNDVADIRLTGALTLGGTCDSPRVKAQLEEIALQFSTVKSVKVYINNKLLSDLLSLK